MIASLLPAALGFLLFPPTTLPSTPSRAMLRRALYLHFLRALFQFLVCRLEDTSLDALVDFVATGSEEDGLDFAHGEVCASTGMNVLAVLE